MCSPIYAALAFIPDRSRRPHCILKVLSGCLHRLIKSMVGASHARKPMYRTDYNGHQGSPCFTAHHSLVGDVVEQLQLFLQQLWRRAR